MRLTVSARAASTLGLLIVLSTLAPAYLSAHHSFAAEFDANQTVTLSGTVSRLEWTNPHARLFVRVKSKPAAAAPAAWAFELASPNALQGYGWNRNILAPGEEITVSGYLAKDGSRFAKARYLLLPGGQKLLAAAPDPARPLAP